MKIWVHPHSFSTPTKLYTLSICREAKFPLQNVISGKLQERLKCFGDLISCFMCLWDTFGQYIYAYNFTYGSIFSCILSPHKQNPVPPIRYHNFQTASTNMEITSLFNPFFEYALYVLREIFLYLDLRNFLFPTTLRILYVSLMYMLYCNVIITDVFSIYRQHTGTI